MVAPDQKYTKLNGMYNASMKSHGMGGSKAPHTVYGGNVYTLPQKKVGKKERGRSMAPDRPSRKNLKSGLGSRKRDNS